MTQAPESIPSKPIGLSLTSFDPAFSADPHKMLDELREMTPVIYDSAMQRYILTRLEDVEAVLRDGVRLGRELGGVGHVVVGPPWDGGMGLGPGFVDREAGTEADARELVLGEPGQGTSASPRPPHRRPRPPAGDLMRGSPR